MAVAARARRAVPLLVLLLVLLLARCAAQLPSDATVAPPLPLDDDVAAIVPPAEGPPEEGPPVQAPPSPPPNQRPPRRWRRWRRPSTSGPQAAALEVQQPAQRDADASAAAAAAPFSPGQLLPERAVRAEQLPAGARALNLEELQGGGQPGFSPAAGPAGAGGLASLAGAPGVASKAFGLAGAPFSDSRFSGGYRDVAQRTVGRLVTRFGGNPWSCTGTVVARALVLTAAHCIFNYGRNDAGWPDIANGDLQIAFTPGLDASSAPLGTWWAQSARVAAAYASGTDTCSTQGVVCNNDVALVWLKPGGSSNRQVGDVTGWMGTAWDGFSSARPSTTWGLPPGPASTQVTAFGYPGAFDSGTRLQVSHSAAYALAASTPGLRQQIRGSAFTAGSSGGPWVVNYGESAALTGGITYGADSARNVIIGVTSWGYVDSSGKAQGASLFGRNAQFPASYGSRGAGNVAKLLFDACDNPAEPGWQLASKGLCT